MYLNKWKTIYVFKPKAIHGSIVKKCIEAREEMEQLMKDGWEPFAIVATDYGERHYYRKMHCKVHIKEK